MLEIADLVKVYRTGEQAVDLVSFTVSAGEVLGLVGPSGAGKSTIIRCINRLVEPTSGRIALDGVMITGLSRRALQRARRKIGMIFQEFALVERLTVMENVLSGRLSYVPFWRSFFRRFRPYDVALAFRLLDQVGLIDHVDRRADTLSGGQRQRVGIARALAQEPRLLLVDEPTASLDPKTSRQIMRLIVEAARARNLPVIINIHDVMLAQMFVDRIIGLRGGRVVFDGVPAALDAEALTRIYGEEDWTKTARQGDWADEAGEEEARRQSAMQDQRRETAR